MPTIHWDIETLSAAKLKKVGARRYAADPSTRVLCVCYAVDDGPIESFVPEESKLVPDVFLEAARNPDWSLRAHNAPFEDAITQFVLGPRFNWPWIPIERHVCTMALARYHGLPGELGKAAKLLDLPFQKDREGARLMLELCRPRKPKRGEDPSQLCWAEVTPEEIPPEKLARLIEYCKNDVAVEREIARRLSPLPDEEQRLWVLDRKINGRGFRVDLELAAAACKLVSAEKAHINREIATLTDGEVTGFTKIPAMCEFINARGHDTASLDKDAVTALLAGNPSDTVRAVLELRQAASNPAVEKYTAVLASAFPDQRIRGLLTYYGTHTGRWTSSGFNIHNLPREDSGDALAAIAAICCGDLEQVRSFGPPHEVIARLARGVVIAPPGKLLLAGDFSVIEPRVASWLSGESWKLDNFHEFDRTGDPMLDAHRVVGAQMRGRPVDPTDDEARQHGKTVHMALNYGGGPQVWRAHVPDDPRSDAEIKVQEIDKFRRLHPAQTKFMFDLDKQALHCVRHRQPLRCKRHSLEMEGNTLILRLPSGRALFYPHAHIKSGRFGKAVVAYHNSAKNREDEMWYGAWLAHLVSATSRDLLVNALFKLDAVGFDVVLHVHDEIVAEIDADDAAARERFKACMLDAPSWAEGLPLAAKVRIGPRYIKTDAPAKAKAEDPWAPGVRAADVPIAAGPFVPFGNTPATGVCAQCRLDPPDGSETARQLDGDEKLWLHPHCEAAFMRRRLAEEGISQGTAPTPEPAPASAPEPAPPDPAPAGYRNGVHHAMRAQSSIMFDVSEVTTIDLADLIDEPVPENRKICCRFHDEETPSLHIYPDHYYCFGCHAYGDHIDWLVRTKGLSHSAAQAVLANWTGPVISRDAAAGPTLADIEEAEKDRAYVLKWWDAAKPIRGTLAARYLSETRGIDLDALPDNVDDVLRFHPRCVFGPGGAQPCLIALMRDAGGDAPTGIQRIALTADARKIGRMMLGSSGVVKLWPAGKQLVVGEGLETVLAAATRLPWRDAPLRPAWAALSDGGLKKFPLIDGVERLILLADNDANRAGQLAAETCKRRWQEAGRRVAVLTPDPRPNEPKTDFNDIILSDREAAS